MIKRWYTFNESNSVDNFKSEVEKIRGYFIEFEDIESVSYDIKVKGKAEDDMLWSINPNTGNFDRWLASLSELANRYLSNEDYRKLFISSSGGQLDTYPFCLCVNIKLKGEKDTKYYGANCNISDDGVEMLQDILISYQRLKEGYDKVILDLNSSHSDYKLVTIKVYFNPITD